MTINLRNTALGLVIAALLFTWVLVGVAFWIRIDHLERRTGELELTTRPLIVVDKYSSVYLNGEDAYGVNNPGDQ